VAVCWALGQGGDRPRQRALPRPWRPAACNNSLRRGQRHRRRRPPPAHAPDTSFTFFRMSLMSSSVDFMAAAYGPSP